MKHNMVAPSILLALGGLIIGAAVGPGVGLTGSIYEAGSKGYDLGSSRLLLEQIEQAAWEAAEDPTACPYEDQSWGYGGQSGSCTFECSGPSGFFTAEVQTDDPSAGVSASGNCGSHDAHCSGEGYCNDRVAYTSKTAGSCSGDSDEITDNGIYVNCYAEAEDEGTGTSGGHGPKCILYSPVLVCYEESTLPPLPLQLCSQLRCSIDDGAFSMASDKPGIFLYAGPDGAIGAICGTSCHFVTPSVSRGAQTTVFV